MTLTGRPAVAAQATRTHAPDSCELRDSRSWMALTLTLKCRAVLVTARQFCADRVAGFDKGRRPVRWSRIGLASSLPALAQSGPPRGFPCQIPLRPWNFSVNCDPEASSLFAPADRRQAPPRRERQRELRRARRVGGASGPAGRLEIVQKLCTEPSF